MNKIKLMYDVVTKLREKEKLTGKVIAKGTKESKKVIEANIDFEKDFVKGFLKSDVSINVDCDKKKFKHHSKTESVCEEGKCKISHMNFMKHIHKEHNFHDNQQFCGKGKLSKLAFSLQVLHNVKLEELADDKVKLILNSDDFSEELCAEIHKKIVKCCEKKHKDMFNNCCKTDKHNGKVELIVNDKKNIEKIIIKISGLKNNGKENTVIAEFNVKVDLF